jgi:flagellar hook-length control protein FliK
MERHQDVPTEKELMQKLVQLMGKHGHQGESMQGIPEKMLHFMDRMHEWNRFQNLNQAPLFFCIPLDGQNPQKLEILYKPLHHSKNNKKFLVVLHLDFEGTGHLRADILKENQKLTATLWAGSKEMEKKLNQELPKLTSRFRKAGLEHVQLSVVESIAHAERKPAELVKSYHEGVFDLEA